MVGASKILTVSYGTFSCTLEGFDDPFNTMKAIAEYFRDLAAEDRYFGAEPPQPDAAMLHRIAEREGQRRVEAKIQDNGVILRAAAAEAPLSAIAVQASATTDPVAATAAAPLPADPFYDDPALQFATASTRAEAPISESVAAKLSRIRAAVSSSRAAGETTRPPQSLAAMLAAAEAEEQSNEAARIEAARIEADRLADEQAAAAQAESDRIAADQHAKEQAAAEAARLAADLLDAERIASETAAEAERLAADAREGERIAAAHREATEQAESARLALEQAEAARHAVELAEAQRRAEAEAAMLETAHLEANRNEAARSEAARIEADRLAAEAMAEIERMAALEDDFDDSDAGFATARPARQSAGLRTQTAAPLVGAGLAAAEATGSAAPEATRAEDEAVLAALAADFDLFEDEEGPATDRFDDEDILRLAAMPAAAAPTAPHATPDAASGDDSLMASLSAVMTAQTPPADFSARDFADTDADLAAAEFATLDDLSALDALPEEAEALADAARLDGLAGWDDAADFDDEGGLADGTRHDVSIPDADFDADPGAVLDRAGSEIEPDVADASASVASAPEVSAADVQRDIPTSFAPGFTAGPEAFFADAGTAGDPEAIAGAEAIQTTPAELLVPEVPGSGPLAAPKHPAPDAEVMAKAQRARARVIKIRRAAVAEADPETAAAGPLAAPLAKPETSEALPEASLAGAANPDASQTKARAPVLPGRPVSANRPVTPNRPVAVSRPGLAADEDESVSRLIQQTNSEMEGPENRRRLSAIAHLKAAVAATVADRKAGGDDGPSEESRINPYRSDLERVVRPRQSGPGDAPMSKPAQPDRPAPLMLVSEQRIDAPRPARSAPLSPIMPVRPRRVGAGGLAVSAQAARNDDEDEDDLDLDLDLDLEDDTAAEGNIFGTRHNFSDFAEHLGAQSLPELLEAAAAYAACIEGRPHVTRPHMVRHVVTLRPDLGEKREDLLRSFGTLLREGRIEKLRRGQFALNSASPLLAEGRKLAQD